MTLRSRFAIPAAAFVACLLIASPASSAELTAGESGRKTERPTGIETHGIGAVHSVTPAELPERPLPLAGARTDDLIMSAGSTTQRASAIVKLSGTPMAGGVSAFATSADGQTAIYIADQNTAGTFELFSVAVDGTVLPPTKISDTIVAGGLGVVNFQISPDNLNVIYLADQDTAGLNELYSVPIGGPSSSAIKLSNGDVVVSFGVSPDGARVAFLEGPASTTTDVFTVPTTGGTTVQLSDVLGLHAAGTVAFVTFSPDSSRLAYITDELVDETFDAYSVPIDGPLASRVKLNPTLALNRFVDLVKFTPDSSRVLYSSDEGAALVFDLFSILPTGPTGSGIQISDPMAGIGIANFSFTPNSARVIYRADQETAFVDEVFSAPVATAGASVKLNGPLVSGGNVLRANVAPDGLRMTYVADEKTNNIFELYSAPVDGSAASIKLHGPTGGDSVGFFGSLGTPIIGNRAIYPLVHSSGIFELYSVPVDGSQPFVRLNDPLPASATLFSAYLPAPTGTTLFAYSGEQNAVGLVEAFATSMSGNLSPIPINGSIAAPQAVSGFLINSTEEYAVYSADETTAGTVELYSRALDSDQDGVDNGTDTCPYMANASQNPVVFGQTILAEGVGLFSWPNNVDASYVKGPLASVGSYAVTDSGSLLDSVSYDDPVVPGAGTGFYYLLEPFCAGSSWQTVLGAQPNRDTTLP